MKANTIICYLAYSALFNPETVKSCCFLDVEHTIQLNTALALNHLELYCTFTEQADAIFCFDESDKEFLPPEFASSGNIYFTDTNDKTASLNKVAAKYFTAKTNNIIVFLDSVGITFNEISQALNLLAIEDEAMVVAKTDNDLVAMLGFNTYNEELFAGFNWDNFNYDEFLSKAIKHEHFLHVLNGFLVVNTIDDFKKLYVELSKKESLAYCSQAIHERFTNIFIEYKDLLK